MTTHIPPRSMPPPAPAPDQLAAARAAVMTAVIQALSAMSDEHRLEIMDELALRYCRHCGCTQPTRGRQCCCWDDS